MCRGPMGASTDEMAKTIPLPTFIDVSSSRASFKLFDNQGQPHEFKSDLHDLWG